MPNSVRFAIALHNHQPVGNFEGVFEAAYRDSYAPFLEVLEDYPEVRISLHTSGSLLEWLAEHHGEYIDRLRRLEVRGQVEIMGGGFYEPILTMIPPADRRGQIALYSKYLQELFGRQVRGAWVPERVWEQELASSLVDAGIEYTVLDDYHFKNAGLVDEQLLGYFVSEDDGRLLKIFPGSEQMRYFVPFQDPERSIEHFRWIADRHPGALVVYADDGEKFGVWPETKKHVYENGWLRRFFDCLTANREWVKLCTLTEAVEQTSPIGKIYLPNASYREMTEWALPVDQLVEYESMVKELEHHPRWGTLARFLRGGFWRNFKVKYPESDEMYCRMLQVSRRLEETKSAAADSPTKAEIWTRAQRELYRGQCNCAYWHGAFGGLYLPHLRNAVYQHLIAADNALEELADQPAAWVEIKADDYNLDARQEVRLANDKLVAYLAPTRGGHLYELDVRAIQTNLLATLARRPEAYHHRILAAARGGAGPGHDVQSIHDRVVLKQEGLDRRLFYDPYLRKSLIDHFFAADVDLQAVVECRAEEQGDFVTGVYETRLRRNPGRVQAVLARQGTAAGRAVRVTKSITLDAESSALELRYLLEGLPRDVALHFAVEFNFAALPGGAPDRYFYTPESERLGQLETQLNLKDAELVGLLDDWLGIDVALGSSKPAGVWTFPVETVSQSESGFELVHQNVCVIPHWRVVGDARGQWQVDLTLSLDTSAAEARREVHAAV